MCCSFEVVHFLFSTTEYFEILEIGTFFEEKNAVNTIFLSYNVYHKIITKFGLSHHHPQQQGLRHRVYDRILINGLNGQDVTIYTIDGRIIASVPRATEHVAIPVTTTGVYIVKVGEHPARKVVVIK